MLSRSGRSGLYFAPVGKVNKAPFLPRKILSSVTAFACSAETNYCRSSLMLMLMVVPFKTNSSHNHSFSSAKQQYLIRGTPWQVCRQPIRLRVYRKIQCDIYVYSELTVEPIWKADRAGSDCRSGGTWGSVWKCRRHFHTRQNICALREQRQRFYCTAFLKGTQYILPLWKTERRTLENGNHFRVRTVCVRGSFVYFADRGKVKARAAWA